MQSTNHFKHSLTHSTLGLPEAYRDGCDDDLHLAGEETEAAKAGHSSCLVELGPGSGVAHCGGWMEQGQPQ